MWKQFRTRVFLFQGDWRCGFLIVCGSGVGNCSVYGVFIQGEVFFSPTFSYSGHKSEMDSLSTDQKEGNKNCHRFLWTTAACACTWQCIKQTSGCSPVWLAVRIFSIIPAYGYVGCPDGHISEARHQQQREIKQAVKRLSHRPSLPLNSL